MTPSTQVLKLTFNLLLAVVWWPTTECNLNTTQGLQRNLTDNNTTQLQPLKDPQPESLITIRNALRFLAASLVVGLLVFALFSGLYLFRNQNKRIRRREAYALDELRRQRPPAPEGTLPKAGYKVHKKVKFTNRKLGKVPIPTKHALPSNPPIKMVMATPRHVTIDPCVDAFPISGRDPSEFLSEHGYDRRRDPEKGKPAEITGPQPEKEKYETLHEKEDIKDYEELFGIKYGDRDRSETEKSPKTGDQKSDADYDTIPFEFVDDDDEEKTAINSDDSDSKSYHSESQPEESSSGSGTTDSNVVDRKGTYSQSPSPTLTKSQSTRNKPRKIHKKNKKKSSSKSQEFN